MERLRYLSLCRQQSETKDARVRYDGSIYAPYSYVMYYDAYGNLRHSAELISLEGHKSVIRAPLSQILEVKDGDK